MTEPARNGEGGAAHSRSITLLVICQTAAISVWFAGSAAVSSAVSAGLFPAGQAGLLSSAVQLGFVAGTLLMALSGAADRFDPRRVFSASALLAGASTLALAASGLDGHVPLLLRALTGAALAGVYPIGMKLVAGWSRSSLGLPMGLLVGALTLGSAMPNLFVAFGSSDWIVPIVMSAASAALSAILILFVALGPHHAPPTRFRLALAVGELRRPEIRRVTFGYLGHMWELYAMWAWVAAFLHWAAPAEIADRGVSILAFTAIASGALGCVAGGWIADRVGKHRVIAVSLIVSGLCAATVGLFASSNWFAVVFLVHVWGIAVIADSGNFSALASEYADKRYLGTVLTLQVSAGFLTTFAVIQLVPVTVQLVGWRYAFAFLAIGPLVSLVSMRQDWLPNRRPR